MQHLISKIVLGHSLSYNEATEALHIIMNGDATNAQIGSFLTALRMKGETAEEIAGFASSMVSHATTIHPTAEVLLDTCGTGGDNSNTFNISTVTAIVAAGSGVSVVKHGNRAVSSNSGSADLLEALGVKIDCAPTETEQCINEIGIGFLFAPVFHQATKNVALPRKEIGIRTVFNILGPLVNPAHATHQLIGVYDHTLTNTFAHVLQKRGVKRALVVHGGGLDELNICSNNTVTELVDGNINSYTLDPNEYGLYCNDTHVLKGGSVKENVAITQAILDGVRGGPRDVVCLNAGAALYICEKADSIKEGIQLAQTAIDSGAAQKTLTRLIEWGKQPPVR